MPLVSQLFSGDQRLEACLVNDQAHLTIGTRGPFVNKVQRALLVLADASISQADVTTMTYGTSTAGAVLAYKTQRAIINRAYQSKPDNIVGKMTIRALDEEMARIERTSPRRNCCGDPIGGSSAGRAQSSQFAATQAFGVGETRIGFELPKVLRVGWQITNLGVQTDGRRHTDMMDAGNQLMDNLLIVPVGGDLRFVAPFDYPMTIDAKVPSDVFGLARAAIKARPMFLSELRVIVHPFVSTAPEFGITDGGAFDGKMFPNFIIINSNKTRPDRLTLLHEMIHATGLTVHDDDPVAPTTVRDPTSVFSINDKRDHIRPEHLERLGKMPWCDFFPTL